MPWRQRPHSELLRYVTTSCRWKTFLKTFQLQFGSWWLLDGKGRQESAALPGTKQFACGSSCVAACIETWIRGGGNGWDERDERMDGMDVKESHSSSSSGPAVEPSAEAGTTPAPPLTTWSSVRELHSRLRELGAPIYGTKDVLFRRLCEKEQIAARKKKEEEYLESRRKELAVATELVTPKILPGPTQPSEVQRRQHMVNHVPPAPWCELCVMGRGKDDPHLRSALREKGEQLPVTAFDIAFVKTTSASGETEQKYATTLVAVDADLFFVKVIPVLGKETTDYSATGLVNFIEGFFHKRVRLRCDGDSATVALASEVKNMAGDLVKFETTPKHSSASNPAERAIQAVEEQSRTIRADCQMRFGSGETFGADTQIWAWLLRHAGWQISRYNQKGNGMTAYKQAYGMHYTHDFVPFAEIVLVRVPKPTHRGLQGGKTLTQVRLSVPQGCLGR